MNKKVMRSLGKDTVGVGETFLEGKSVAGGSRVVLLPILSFDVLFVDERLTRWLEKQAPMGL